MTLREQYEKETGKSVYIDNGDGGFEYGEGYIEWLEAELEGWISVEDRLPEEYRNVLVAGGVAYIKDDRWWSIMGAIYPGRPITWEVTYWHPLPEPPEKPTKPLTNKDSS
jgi:hypothetical protein